VIEVALHLETGSKELNHRLCAFIGEYKSALEKGLEESITLQPDWGSRWSSVFIKRSREPWSEDVARWAAEKMHTLMEKVQPLLDDFFARAQGD
jgi:hypothetical protein